MYNKKRKDDDVEVVGSKDARKEWHLRELRKATQ